MLESIVDFLCLPVPRPVEQHLFVRNRSATIGIQTPLLNSYLLNILINKCENYWQSNLLGEW